MAASKRSASTPASGSDLTVGVQAEAHVVAHRHHPDRDRVALGQRHHRIGLLKPAAAQVERDARARDIRDHEVERARAGDQVREHALHRCRRVASRAHDRIGLLGQTAALARRGLVVHVEQAHEWVGLVARQGDEHERDAVAELVVVAVAHVDRDHRLQPHRLAAALDEEVAGGARARGQHDVVDGHAEARLDLAQVGQRPPQRGQVPVRRGGLVEGRRPGRGHERVADRPGGAQGVAGHGEEPARRGQRGQR